MVLVFFSSLTLFYNIQWMELGLDNSARDEHEHFEVLTLFDPRN